MQYLSDDIFDDVVAIAGHLVFHDALMKDAALILSSNLEVCLEKRLNDDPQLIMRVSRNN